MKILLVSNGDFFSTYGGGQVYVKNLIDEMIRQQLDVVVISFVSNQQNPIEKKTYKGIELYEVGRCGKEDLKNLILSIAPTVVHAHSHKAFFSEICKELHIPYIITAHHGGITCPAGTLLNHRDEICRVCVNDKDCLSCVMRNTRLGLKCFYPLMKHIPFAIRMKMGSLIERLPFIYFVTPIGIATKQIQDKKKEWQTIAQNSDIVIAPSNAIADNMILNGLDKEKIRVIPHGIPIQNPIIPPKPTNEKMKFFYVGRIGYIKGIHLLLSAFVKLDPSLCELHLIGSLDGKYEKNLVKKYGKADNVFFHGKVANETIPDVISTFDVLVHPAIYLEVFGLNIAEALSQGKPVIATRCGGAEMQVKDGENGLLIEPNSEEELYVAMKYMVEHPEERAEMAKKAPERVIIIESHTGDLMKIYTKLVTV